jgi:hypothetical protein
MSSEIDGFEYDIAFSFAGEDRATVQQLANELIQRNVRIFYDMDEKAELWGKDLYQYSQEIYRDRARYCVIFVSAAYAEKTWARHELKQAQARAIKEHREYILPVRLDDTEIPGLNATVGYIDLREHSVQELRDLILKKLYGPEVQDEDLAELTWKGDLVEFRGMEIASFWPEKLARAQTKKTYVVEVPRIRYGDESWDLHAEDIPCHDCAAVKDEFHDPGCDAEECPICHGQAMGCDCILE